MPEATNPDNQPLERPRHAQVADPEISRRKFAEEVASFRATISAQMERGIFLIRAEFPEVLLLFAAPQVKPSPLVFAAKLDFTDYDASPISVVLVNPFTQEPYTMSNAPVKFQRKVIIPPIRMEFPELLQAHLSDDIPFFCIPGVREYHTHPAHTGDSWFLHRGVNGEGTLAFIVEQLHTYGIQGISSYNVTLSVSGLALDINKIPE